MSALGSKREKFASIFKRVDGLLRNGAIPYEERPLWYDVYKAFPPRVEPMFNRPLPTNEVRQILYHEDVDRVEAFKRYQKLGYLNCFKVADNRSNLSRLLSKCQEVRLRHPELDGDKLFTVVEEELQKDGVLLTKKN
ncbi:hypothetical protein CRM22_006645 [Opisthorchis felineus]|uniref:Small ribosomal subunit protein mS23 n=1 Tax=Opisthorchis felineus TaxID=147828 RepID=A0A4S2LLN7_OPIFE|nr:hypothetical protein CRM22_006645 [Opisthorchis felineus]